MNDISLPEITLLTLRGIVSLTILLGLIDTAFAIGFAVIQGKFDASYTANFIVSHGKIWLAIIALAVLGNGVKVLDIPPLTACSLGATAALIAYAITVIQSLITNARDSRAPVDPS